MHSIDKYSIDKYSIDLSMHSIDRVQSSWDELWIHHNKTLKVVISALYEHLVQQCGLLEYRAHGMSCGSIKIRH